MALYGKPRVTEDGVSSTIDCEAQKVKHKVSIGGSYHEWWCFFIERKTYSFKTSVAHSSSLLPVSRVESPPIARRHCIPPIPRKPWTAVSTHKAMPFWGKSGGGSGERKLLPAWFVSNCVGAEPFWGKWKHMEIPQYIYIYIYMFINSAEPEIESSRGICMHP